MNDSSAERAAVGDSIDPADRLHIPHRKRMSHGYVTSEDGARQLCLYYGLKEISFDEPHLFAFGEQLVRQSSFIAGAATAWGPGYAWDEIRPLLEALVDEGIIKRGETSDDPRGGGLVASPLPPASCPIARAWSAADCEAITRELGGRPVEIGHLEALVSVYRIAHPALDGDDRQVGEANVYPPGLRVDRDAEWRVCQYAGSRYRDHMPMNVTALKAMIKHWKPLIAVLLAVRGELRRRLAVHAGWTVGDLHLFSSVVLALPAFQLMADGAGARAAQRPVHPILSSLFRITDGVRMVTHLMVMLSDERTRSPDEPVTASELYGFAERNGLFLSNHGVCAGPKPMIDELLEVVFSDEPAEQLAERYREGELAPEVGALLARLPDAVDYGLLAFQSWAVSRSLWLRMSLACRALRELTGATTEGGVCMRLRARLDAAWGQLEVARIAADRDRDVHLSVYRDIYAQAWRCGRCPDGAPTLDERTAPCPEAPHHAAAAGQLRAILAARFAGSELGHGPAIERMVAILVLYLREEQAALRSIEAIQSTINARLNRARPARPLTGRDLHVPYVMLGEVAEFAYLFDLLHDELGLWVECTARSIEIAPRAGNAAPAPEPRCCAGNSAGAR